MKPRHGSPLHQMTITDLRELVVDNFAGGGGASTGIALALGRSVDIAINHDPSAIAMHKTNHPDTKHYCESVWDIDPRKVTRGLPVGLAWFSPDCKHFSKAKGGKPVEKQIRGLAWVAIRWAAAVRPRVIMLENVEEFVTWGPLMKGPDGEMYPDPERKSQTFQAFVNKLRRLGYQADWRELRACDYGAPTIRKRFFLIARCDGLPIIWPTPTHGDPKSTAVKAGNLLPWRTAAEIIDWSIPCPSIFERKRPLKDATLRRIARGIMKFVVNNAAPFIIPVTHQGSDRVVSIDAPFPTVTAAHRGEHALISACVAKHYGGNYTGAGSSASEPLSTVTATDHNALVTAFLAQYHSETVSHHARGQTLDRPILTVDAANRYGLVTSNLIKLRGTCADGQPVTEPMPTITAGGLHVGEVRAFLQRYVGSEVKHERPECNSPVDRQRGSGNPSERRDMETRHRDLAGALRENRTEASGVHVEERLSGNQGLRGQQAIPSPGASGGMVDPGGRHTGRNGLEPHGRQQEEQRSEEPGSGNPERESEARRGYRPEGLRESSASALGGGDLPPEGRHELFTDRQESGRVADDSVQSCHRETVAFVTKYYGSVDNGQTLDDPLHTVTSKHRFGLVTVEGEDYQIVDIGMRMLQPRELFNAQDFPPDYIIDVDCDGKKYSKAGQVARCGNAVPPAFSRALVQANLPELCGRFHHAVGVGD